MQALLAEHAWDWKAALRALQRFILAHLGDPESIVVPDETAELTCRFSVSSAAAPGALASSPRPSTYCRSARHKQDGKGSLEEIQT
jgi:hypothetical protein